MKTNVASEGDILPTDGGLEDSAFLRLDDSIAEIHVLGESVYRDDGNLDETAERYASFYETAERIIVRLLKFRGIEVDAQRTSPFHHRYHESVLQILADKGNVFHHILGSGDVWDSLRHAKTFRNKQRSDALSVDELHSCGEPCIEHRTKLIAEAIQKTNHFARKTIRREYLDSTLIQLLETHAVDSATPEIERVHRNWLTLQDSGHQKTLSTVLEPNLHLELGSNEYNTHERVRSALLNMFNSHLSIVQKTLDDVSSMFERVPKHGQAQEQLLNRFVFSRLDKRRQQAKGDLDIRMVELSKRIVDIIRVRTNRVVALETLNRQLRMRGEATAIWLRIRTIEVKEELEQVTKLKEEKKDLILNLQQATSNYNNAINRSKTVSDENAILRSQLEAERKSHEACQSRLATLEREKKLLNESYCGDSHIELGAELASHGMTMRWAVGFLNNKVTTMQEEMDNFRDELAVQRSSREAAEAKARSFEDEVDSFRIGMESMLCRPRPDRT